MREYLKDLAIYYSGNHTKIEHALEKAVCVPNQPCSSEYLTLYDHDYPDKLRCLQSPPFVLFYKGNLSLLKQPSISVVGSRVPSSYGQTMSACLVDRLKRRYVVVSGLARGIDGIAHQSALDGLGTIGVLGSGINRCYPKENMKLYRTMCEKHLVISEYPEMTAPNAWHFPIRNRIIAALGDSLWVMSASVRSGTMLSVNEALILDRPIYCLPYPITDKSGEGCNRCIQDGAMILTNMNDLDMI